MNYQNMYDEIEKNAFWKGVAMKAGKALKNYWGGLTGGRMNTFLKNPTIEKTFGTKGLTKDFLNKFDPNAAGVTKAQKGMYGQFQNIKKEQFWDRAVTGGAAGVWGTNKLLND